jgi:hypothetical protein
MSDSPPMLRAAPIRRTRCSRDLRPAQLGIPPLDGHLE